MTDEELGDSSIGIHTSGAPVGSQLGSFNRRRHWDSGSILEHSSAEEGYPEDLCGWGVGAKEYAAIISVNVII